jgi:adenylosuccinate lyase
MRAIWSEANKRRGWRRVWVALAEAQSLAGLVTPEQVADLRTHQDDIDIEAAHALERQIHHDLMAELRVFADQCPVGGGIIHLGATSMDIEDNAEALRLRDALLLLDGKVVTLLASFARQIERWADHPCMAFTHLQPAEPTTVGYRLAGYAQDLVTDLEELRHATDQLRGKGIKGAVGTAASYSQLLEGQTMTATDLDGKVMALIGLAGVLIAGQTYPRKQDALILNVLAGVAMSLYKFAFDLRVLQSPTIGEWAEPFGSQQVGSSAMPFKRNPINAEKIDSLGRLVGALAQVGWDNAAHSLLERTLDDSANRREALPTAFLAVDEMLGTAQKIIDGLRVDEIAIARNLNRFGTFAAVERLLMELVKAGADRQAMHERLRTASMNAWATLAQDQPNPLIETLTHDPVLIQYLDPGRIRSLLDASAYVGTAPLRARQLVDNLRQRGVLAP